MVEFCLEDSTERSESNPGRSLGIITIERSAVWKTVPTHKRSIRVRFTTEFFSNTDLSLSLQKNATQSHKLQNNQGKSMIAEDSFVPLL